MCTSSLPVRTVTNAFCWGMIQASECSEPHTQLLEPGEKPLSKLLDSTAHKPGMSPAEPVDFHQ